MQKVNSQRGCSIKNIFTGIFLFLIFTAVSYSQDADDWIQQNSTTTENLFDVFFVDSNTGWAVGQTGIIIKTTDGGYTWFLQNSGISSNLHALCFTNSQSGWVVGDNGTILHTTNGGNTWNLQSIKTTSLIKSIYFINDSLGWLCGDAIPSVYKTTNGGDKWISVGSNEFRNNSIFFISEDIGWIAGPGVAKTINGGNSWTPCDVNINSHSVFFINDNKGWVVGSPYDAYKTMDGGSHWNPFTIESCLFLNDIFFTDENNGWTTGDGIHKTTDGGASWSKVQSSSDFLASFFIDSNVGWVVGSNGRIIKTSTGGVSDVNENISERVESFQLYQNYPNPFNPQTVISYNISVISDVSLKIFDILGREVITLANGIQSPGTHTVEWNGKNSAGRQVASGVYFCRLQAGKFIETRKLTFIK